MQVLSLIQRLNLRADDMYDDRKFSVILKAFEFRLRGCPDSSFIGNSKRISDFFPLVKVKFKYNCMWLQLEP